MIKIGKEYYFTIECKNCKYYWTPKNGKLPAKCASCGRKIYGTTNYKVIDSRNKQDKKFNLYIEQIRKEYLSKKK